MLFHLGGQEICEKVLGKKIDTGACDEVYDYERIGSSKLETYWPTFLRVKEYSQFRKLYSEERKLQTEAMHGDEDRASKSLFAHELLEIYELISSVIQAAPEQLINIKVACCLPVHRLEYFWRNMDGQVLQNAPDKEVE